MMTDNDPKQVASERLDDQLRWYENRARRNQRNYRVASVLEVALAATITLVAAIPDLPWRPPLASILAVILTVIKGIETTCQWQANWTHYRSTAEALTREKYLYLARAGPYADAPSPDRLLAERIEDTTRIQGPPPNASSEGH